VSTGNHPGERGAGTSYSAIYHVLRVLGSASIATTALSLLRNKAFAIFLGPAGYGSIVLLNSLVSTAGNLGGIGIGYSATRLISRSRGRSRTQTAAFLEWCLVSLGHRQELITLGLTALVLAAWTYFQGDGRLEPAWIAAVALGAAFSIMASVNTTRLQIKRLSARLAAVSVGSAAIHTAISIACAYAFGVAAVPIIVATIPFSLVVATFIALRDNPVAHRSGSARRVRVVRSNLLRMGAGLMLPGIVDSAGGFAVRAAGAAFMGLAAVGQVFAASALVTFVTVTVMTAMNQDFLPRLCESADRPQVMRRQASEQLLVSLLVSAPVILVFCTFSGEITRIFFSAQFADAARVVPIMSVLVVANISNWPVHTMQTALGHPRDQLLGSIASVVASLLVIALNHRDLDHQVFAAALVAGSIAQLAVQGAMLWIRAGLVYAPRDWAPGVLLIVTVLSIPLVQEHSSLLGIALGMCMAVAWAGAGLMHYARHR
jgi:PST family polysaccharide transporter